MSRSVRGSALFAVLLTGAGCERSDAPSATQAETRAAPVEAEPNAAAEPAPHPRLAPRAPRALTARHMPEDPVLAARTSAATDERRAQKRHKRFLTFDTEHLSVHHALLELIVSARARYDRAHSEKALSAARAAMPAKLTRLEEGIATLDSKGMGSRLLADYEALHAALATSYPDAKLAGLRGDASPLKAEQASFDQRLTAMNAWLEEVRAVATAEAERKSR